MSDSFSHAVLPNITWASSTCPKMQTNCKSPRAPSAQQFLLERSRYPSTLISRGAMARALKYLNNVPPCHSATNALQRCRQPLFSLLYHSRSEVKTLPRSVIVQTRYIAHEALLLAPPELISSRIAWCLQGRSRRRRRASGPCTLGYQVSSLYSLVTYTTEFFLAPRILLNSFLGSRWTTCFIRAGCTFSRD